MSLVVFAFLKCPLIGCTVTVSCFNCPLWYLNVAYMTLRPWGENLIFGTQKQWPLTTFSYFCFESNSAFSSFCWTSVYVFNVSFEGDLFFSYKDSFGPVKSKIRLVSTPFHNPYLACVCASVCQPLSDSSVNIVTCLPSQPQRKASYLGSRGPWLVHLIDLATASLYTPATSNGAASAVLKDLGGLWSHYGVYGCGSGCTTL